MTKIKRWLTKEGLLKWKAGHVMVLSMNKLLITWVLLALHFIIGERNIQSWIKLYVVEKEVVDREVENALLKRALGYTYEEVTVENNKLVKTMTFKMLKQKG